MRYLLARFLPLFSVRPLPAFAWNGTGHEITGAIAYQELSQRDPLAVAGYRLANLLKRLY